MLIFSKYKYLHVKIASLANVKSCVTVGPISLMANVWPCIVPVPVRHRGSNFINGKCLALYSPSGLSLRLSSLTEDT